LQAINDRLKHTWARHAEEKMFVIKTLLMKCVFETFAFFLCLLIIF